MGSNDRRQKPLEISLWGSWGPLDCAGGEACWHHLRAPCVRSAWQTHRLLVASRHSVAHAGHRSLEEVIGFCRGLFAAGTRGGGFEVRAIGMDYKWQRPVAEYARLKLLLRRHLAAAPPRAVPSLAGWLAGRHLWIVTADGKHGASHGRRVKSISKMALATAALRPILPASAWQQGTGRQTALSRQPAHEDWRVRQRWPWRQAAAHAPGGAAADAAADAAAGAAGLDNRQAIAAGELALLPNHCHCLAVPVAPPVQPNAHGKRCRGHRQAGFLSGLGARRATAAATRALPRPCTAAPRQSSMAGALTHLLRPRRCRPQCRQPKPPP